MSKHDSFLTEALGPEGSAALAKAVKKSESLAAVLMPRAILGWAMSAARYGYQGPLPGQADTFIELKKSETAPGLYVGALTVGQDTVTFTDSTLYRVAAHLALALDAEPGPVGKNLKAVDLTRLGKSIDVLSKARMLTKALSGPRVMSQHGHLQVVHDGLGVHPYSIRHASTGQLVMDGLTSLSDAQKHATAFGHSAEELDKAVLDPSLGYKISVEHRPKGPYQHSDITVVHVHSPAGQHVGTSMLVHTPKGLQPMTTAVEDAHQRRGIASAMYAHAQKITGKKVIPGKIQTDEAEAFWAGNAKKPQFGKVELPGQTHKPTQQQGPEAPVPPQKQPSQGQAKPPQTTAKPVKAPARTPEKAPKVKIAAPTLTVGKSEAHGTRCRMCTQLQFADDGEFVGCLCFSALAKGTTTETDGESYRISFNRGWDSDALEVLVEALYSNDV